MQIDIIGARDDKQQFPITFFACQLAVKSFGGTWWLVLGS